MVNNTAPVNREGRKSEGMANQPFLAAGAVSAIQDLFGRTVLTVKTLSNAKNAKSRKERDLRGDTLHFDNHHHGSPANQHVSETLVMYDF